MQTVYNLNHGTAGIRGEGDEMGYLAAVKHS